eukprot:TRINITY_DN997_c0_g1_i1.p2 TRINITY_DN997_c0_g1~~TRINITY_DN997_c0_g1_i1.p2  ORF type:complete len:956 (+),score=359.07 TRINITY_DN997_c0_g1_i1:4487-7354(+)
MDLPGQQASGEEGVGNALLLAQQIRPDGAHLVAAATIGQRDGVGIQSPQRRQEGGCLPGLLLDPGTGLPELVKDHAQDLRPCLGEAGGGQVVTLVVGHAAAIGQDAHLRLPLYARQEGIPGDPGIDAATLEGGASVSRREIGRLDVGKCQARLLQRGNQQVVHASGLGDRDLPALEIGDLAQRRIGAHDDGLRGRRGRLLGDIGQLRASGLGKDRYRVGDIGAEIDPAHVECFQQRQATGEFVPADLRTGWCEQLLQRAVGLEDGQQGRRLLVADANVLVAGLCQYMGGCQGGKSQPGAGLQQPAAARIERGSGHGKEGNGGQDFWLDCRRASRQPRLLCSMVRSRPSLSLPSTARIRMAASTRSGRPLSRPSESRQPTPRVAAISSAATRNIHARLRPPRKPANRQGRAAGSRMWRINAPWPRPELVPTSMSLWSMSRMPATRFRQTGKKAPMAMSTTLGVSSMPSHSSSRGIQARLGMARRAWKLGSSQASARRLMPTSRPSAMASRLPMAKPATTRARLAAMCGSSSPRTASDHRVCASSLGGGSRRAGIQSRRALSSASNSRASGRIAPVKRRGRQPSSAGQPWRRRRVAAACAVTGAGAAGAAMVIAAWSLIASGLHHALRIGGIDERVDGAWQVGTALDQVFFDQDGRSRAQGIDVLAADQRMREIIAFQLQARHRRRQSGFFGKQRHGLVGMGDDPGACPFIGGDHTPDLVRMTGRETVADVEEAVGIEIDVAIDQARTSLQLAGRQMRVEAGPGRHAALLQRGATIGVLQVDDLHVALPESVLMQCAQQEQVGIGPLGGGNLLALELGDGLDRRILGHGQRGPFGTRIDVDRLDRIAIGACQQGRQAGGAAEVDAVAVEVFEGAVAALAQDPLDLGALRLEIVFQPAELAQHQAGRRIGGVVETDDLGRLGCARAQGRRTQHGRAERGRRQAEEVSALHGVRSCRVG